MIAKALKQSDELLASSASFELTVDSALLDAFIQLSGDYNPLHQEEAFAQKHGFKKRVAHGAIQQMLVSRLVGMQLPGEGALIHGLSTDYIAPLFEGDTVLVRGQVQRFDEIDQLGVLLVRITRGADLLSTTQVKFGRLGDQAVKSEAAGNVIAFPKIKSSVINQNVVFCGGQAGLASALTPILQTIGMQIHRLGRSGCDWNLDWSDPEFRSLTDKLAEEEVGTWIQFLSLRPQKAAMSRLNVNSLEENIRIHLQPLQAVARAVVERKLPSMKRLILIGSAGARHLFPEKGYEAYSYSKMVASYYCRDLARELAPLGVTINVIAPSEMAIGMNAQVPQKMLSLLSARNPSGKLTTADDVAAVIQQLISPLADSVTGQEIVLNGGRNL